MAVVVVVTMVAAYGVVAGTWIVVIYVLYLDRVSS